jgi:K+-sensing histidine kinase KdpD
VIHILVDNALKFSGKAKSIRVDIRMTAERVTVSVADHG